MPNNDDTDDLLTNLDKMEEESEWNDGGAGP